MAHDLSLMFIQINLSLFKYNVLSFLIPYNYEVPFIVAKMPRSASSVSSADVVGRYH